RYLVSRAEEKAPSTKGVPRSGPGGEGTWYGTGDDSFSERSSKMRLSTFLHRPSGRHENRRPCGAGSWPRRLTLERLEDRTVPSTVPLLGNLPPAPALGNLSAITNALTAPPASPAAGTASSAASSAASTFSG